MSKLKVWFVTIDDEGMGVAVISSCDTKAIKAVAEWCPLEEEEIEHCSIEQKKDIQIIPSDKEGLVLETKDGLLRGVYGSTGENEYTCEICGKDSQFCVAEAGKIVCGDCEGFSKEQKLAS